MDGERRGGRLIRASAWAALIIGAGLASGALPWPSLGFAGQASETIDLSAIDSVTVTGDSSSLVFSTRPGEPRRMEIVPSGWVDRACARRASVRVDGARLTVHVQDKKSWFGRDCDLTITANLKPGTRIDVRQGAFKASVEGAYDAVNLEGGAAKVEFEGHAKSLSVSGAAVKADISYDDTGHGDTIRIRATALDLDLGFKRGTAISYAMNAMVASLESEVPNTVGASPSVIIDATVAKGRITADD